jgi:hypothetical protein
MNTNFYHAMALAGWLINIAGHLLVQYQNPNAYYIQGVGSGLVIIGWMTIIIKNRNQKHEASSR